MQGIYPFLRFFHFRAVCTFFSPAIGIDSRIMTDKCHISGKTRADSIFLTAAVYTGAHARSLRAELDRTYHDGTAP